MTSAGCAASSTVSTMARPDAAERATPQLRPSPTTCLSARMLPDEVIVLNGGRVVEQGPSLEVIRNPQDAYTRLLLDAIPNPFDQAGDRTPIS